MNITTSLYILFLSAFLFDVFDSFVSSTMYRQMTINQNINLQLLNPVRNYTFLLFNDGWSIEGNQQIVEAHHIPHTYNKEMSRFIIGNDSIIHTESRGNNNDKSLWYFRSPLLQADLSNYKHINFSLSCFAGIRESLNKIDHYIRICNQKINLCTKYSVLDQFNFTAQWTKFNVLLDKKLWSQSDKFNKIISNVSYIYILGDWTQWYETVGLDNFLIR